MVTAIAVLLFHTCPGNWPWGLRRSQGVLPAMGKDASIRLSIAAAKVVVQPPPDSPAIPNHSFLGRE
jgi:hypothetical protein